MTYDQFVVAQFYVFFTYVCQIYIPILLLCLALSHAFHMLKPMKGFMVIAI